MRDRPLAIGPALRVAASRTSSKHLGTRGYGPSRVMTYSRRDFRVIGSTAIHFRTTAVDTFAGSDFFDDDELMRDLLTDFREVLYQSPL